MPWVMPEAYGSGDERADAYVESILEDETEGRCDGTDGAGARVHARADAARHVREDRERVDGPGATEGKEDAE